MARAILDQFGRPFARAPRDAAPAGRPGPFRLRRFESAETHRLNEAHWQNAHGQPINLDLLESLDTMRARTAYEEANNGLVAGVITTHAEDIVGPSGPTLRVESDDRAWDEAAEAVWRDWFAAPCPDPRFSGVALLKLWIRSLWKNGEFLAQLITSRHASGPVRLRLKPIHPSRLDTPLAQSGNPRVVMGIEFDDEGVPVRYWIADSPAPGRALSASLDYTPVPADLIIHEFIHWEEEQARGVPFLAPTLDDVADLRDLDKHEMDAAEAAALMGVAWYTEHPESTYIQVNETTDLERKQQWTGPPGWKPMQVKAEHPAPNLLEWRRERQADIGRPVAMPLMTIRLDASKHNYSSARFDGQNYHRAVRGIQMWLSGSPHQYGCMSWLFSQVIAEARFSDRRLRATPRNVMLRWLWPVPPHVDPTKERNAERIGLENGTLPFDAACAANGHDQEAVFRAERRTNEIRAEMGLPPLPPPGSYLRSAQPRGDEDDDEDDEPGGAKSPDEEDADAVLT